MEATLSHGERAGRHPGSGVDTVAFRGEPRRAARAAEARLKGFEGDSCGACGNFTLVRNGTCMKCNTCGSTSGCS